MRKRDIFEKITEIVVNVTEVDKDKILSDDKHSEVTDARYLLIYFCHLEGWYASKIAELSNISKRTVERIISGFENRRRYSHPLFSMNCDIIKAKIRQYKTTYG